jgi:hypothetical protein
MFEDEEPVTIECHQFETPEGWVFNVHQAPGAPPPSPEAIQELKLIAERIAAGSDEGKQDDLARRI